MGPGGGSRLLDVSNPESIRREQGPLGPLWPRVPRKSIGPVPALEVSINPGHASKETIQTVLEESPTDSAPAVDPTRLGSSWNADKYPRLKTEECTEFLDERDVEGTLLGEQIGDS